MSSSNSRVLISQGLDEFFECGEMKGYDKKCKTKKTDGEAGKNGGTGGNAGKEGQAGYNSYCQILAR